MNLSVVVPCYNEEGNINAIINGFEKAFEKLPGVEIILVDNGSTDNTSKILRDELATNRSNLFKTVHVKNNKGYGYGIMEGLKASNGQILAWTHADLQTDPTDVRKAYDIYMNSRDSNILIKGRREKRFILDKLFSIGMQLFTLFRLKSYFNEINAQPKMMSRKFFKNNILNKAPDDFSLDLYLLYKAKQEGLSVIEFPVYYKKRFSGEAKGGGSLKGKWKLILRTIKYINKLALNR